MLIVDNVSKYFGADLIFKDVSFSVGEKDHLVICGNNGAGKTTLLKIIAGEVDFDGKISLVAGFKNIGWLKQVIDDKYLDLSVLDFIQKGRNLNEIESQITQCYNELASQSLSSEDEKKLYDLIENLQAKFDSLGGYNAQNDLYKIIKGCAIDDDLLNMKMGELSGGQKSRVAFAEVLYSAPDVLLLDEPTNHLDMQTKDWILNYIINYKGAVISISHDEEYLNAVSNKVLFIDDRTKTAELFAMSYSQFLDVIKLRDDYLAKTLKSQMKKINEMEAWVRSMKGRSANLEQKVLTREKMIQKLKDNLVEPPKKSKEANISFNVKNVIDKSPLSVSDLTFSYDTKRLIHKLNFSLYPDERFIIVGKNGVGKTTLLKLIAGILKPLNGKINLASKTILAYYAQEQENLNLNNTIIEEVNSNEYTEKQLRALLGNFKFSGDKVFQIIGTLSPGERSRLSLLKLCMKKPNLMLLDEPTNHLDIQTKRILASALLDYKGTILMVSHDWEFLKEFNVSRMLLLPSGRVLDFDENVVKRYDVDD